MSGKTHRRDSEDP